jgi:prevent-host-death family protein
MAVVNVLEAKTHLSRLLAEAEAGKDVVIARDGVPSVKLVPVAKLRVFGADPTVIVPEGSAFFDVLPEEELGAWE